MGNPAQNDWPGFKNYVIATLPRLQYLDGEEITRTMRLVATQQLPKLAVELRSLAAAKRDEKAARAPVDVASIDPDDKSPSTRPRGDSRTRSRRRRPDVPRRRLAATPRPRRRGRSAETGASGTRPRSA